VENVRLVVTNPDNIGEFARKNSVPMVAGFVSIWGAANATAQNAVGVQPSRVGRAATRLLRLHDDPGESA
jgi:hypothetical protein